MKIFGSRFLMAAGLASAAGLMLNVNCGGSDNNSGTGGTTGTGGTHTGGTTGTGGTHTGGTTGTGGSATGGTTGTGGTAGASATGGTAGSSANGGAGGHATGGAGGASATGGTAGGGAGTSGGAGNGGVGGAITGTALATFDPTDAGSTAALEGFVLDKTNNAGNLALATDATPAATLAWDGAVGDPTAGSLVVDAPFHAYNEYFNLQKGYANTNLQDWTGKTTLHVRVKIDSGLNPSASFPPGIQPYVTSYGAPTTDGGVASYNYCGTYQNAVAGNGWAEYTVSLVPSSSRSNCTVLDVSKILNFGVQVQTGGGATGDAGQPAAPTTAVVHIDSFSVS
jgi:hypothetical protein